MGLTNGIQLAPLSVDIRGNASPLMQTLNTSSRTAVSKVENLGKSLTKAGKTLTNHITKPVLGITAAIGTMAVKAESNIAKVNTLLADGTDINKYKKNMIQGSNEMKTSIGEYSEAVYQSISASVDQSKAIGFTNNAIKLAKGGFTDATKAVDVLTSVINAYGLKTSDATSISDKLITTQNAGKTTVGELASSMGKVIPTAKNLNVNIDNVCSAYALMTKNGIQTAETTTYFNSMLNELGTSGSKADVALKEMTGQGFAKLIASGKSVTEVLGLLKQKADSSNLSLSDMFGAAEGAKAALSIMQNDGKDYNDILQQMGDSAGATDKAFKKIDSTPAEKLKGSLNELKNAGIEMGESLIPTINNVSGGIKKFARWISSLDEEQQRSIIKLGLFTASFGPLLSVAGKTISTFSKITTAIKGFRTATTVANAAGAASGATSVAATASSFSLLGKVALIAGPAVLALGAAFEACDAHTRNVNSSILKTTEDMTVSQKIMNALGDDFHKSNKELEEMGIKYTHFSGDVSKNFQNAVETSAEKVRNLKQLLADTKLDGVIDDGDKAKVTKAVDDMVNSCISAIDKKESKAQESLKRAFSADGVIDDSEQATLDAIGKRFETAKQKINDDYGQVQELVKNRTAQNADETDKQIEKLMSDIEAKKLKIQSDSDKEYEAAHKNFTEQCGQYDLKAASKILKQKKSDLDKSNSEVHKAYDKGIKDLRSLVDKSSGDEKKQLQKKLDEMTNQRSDALKKNQKNYSQFYQDLQKNNSKVADNINMITGKVLTDTQKKSQDRLKNIISTHSEMANVTKSGYYTMYNSATGTMDKIAVKIDSKTGEIAAAWNNTTGKGGECMDKSMLKAQKLASTTSASAASMADSMEYWKKATVDSSGNIIDAQGNVITTMDKVKSKNGEVRSGIITLNGTQIKVKVNKDGTIKDLDSIIDRMNNIPKTIDTTVMVTYSDGNGGTFRGSLYTSDGRGGYYTGSHYNGLDNVPFDGYTARLHKGERVLTAEENKNYTNNNSNSSLTLHIDNFVNNRKQDVKNLAEELEFYRQQMSVGKGGN